MSSRRVYSLRQESDHRVHTSLLDNWHYQGSPMALSPHGQSAGPLSLGTFTNFNINEDDMDCPGHSIHHLPTVSPTSEPGDCARMASSSSLEDMYNACLASSSSEGLYDSCEDDMDRKIRAMSVDEVSHHHDDDGSSNVQFMLFHFDEDDTTKWNSDSETPTVQTPSAASGRPERRASMDSGVLGVWEQGKRSMVGAGEWHRNALTEPGTPAEPCTPVASCSVSLEQLLVDSHYVINKLQPLLCAERVNQMTRTYNDIEAVTGLLEEKERDLELAARIGQTLLSKNKDLSGRKEALEEQLSLANDTIKQLKHELSKKVQQLEVYDQDLQNQNQQDDSGVCAVDPSVSTTAVEKLQRKVGSLEEENLSLRMETAQLRSDTETYEVKEKKLVEDSLQQFVELSQKVDTLTEELKGKKKEGSHRREEINSLITQLNNVCQRVRQLTEENTDLLDKLQAAQESQTQLVRELSLQKDKYDELFETLEKTQEHIRSHHGSKGSKSPSCSPSAISMESLASELHKSLSRELSQNEERLQNKPPNWKVFETARAAHRAVAKSRSSSRRLSSSASSCWDGDSLTASVLNSDVESFGSDGYGGDADSVCGSTVELGRPGIPGSNDLQTALQRLALRQGHDLEDINGAHSDRRSEGFSPFKMPGTPDTVSSSTSGYSYLGCSKNAQSSSSQYKMSRRLQIIKPMEGSATLQHWQQLAQPHLGGLFERREGVKVKGERKLDLEEEAYTLSDFEEDEDVTDHADGLVEGIPGQMWSPLFGDSVNHPSPSSHPSLPIHLTPSPRSREASPLPMATSTPHSLPAGSRKKTASNSSASSYTMSLGLAAILQERDTSLTRALMKTSASCPKISPRSLGSGSVAVIPADAVATVSAAASSRPAVVAGCGPEKREIPSSSDNHPGLFGKLISSGYSLLWNKTDAPAAPEHSQETVSTDVAHQAIAKKPTANSSSQVFPRGGAGVLGALTSMRKNGIF